MNPETHSTREQPEQQHRSIELFEALKSGAMTADAFLKEIDSLDQSTPTHADSIQNIEVLEKPEVKDLFDHDPQFENIRSVSHFHVGQIRAMQNRFEEALQAMGKSYEAAQNVDDQEYSDWTEYVKATAMYLRKDLAALERIMKSGKAMNQDVVERLYKGLKETGVVDYRRDYGV